MRRLLLTAAVLLLCAPAFGSTGAKKGECLVPNVVGRALPVAKKAITTAGCRTGKIKNAYSNYVPKNVVMTQNPPGGFRLSSGGVILVVSKGKPKKH